MARTKIICTIGPASEDPDVVRGLIRAGMDVARINFSHGDAATHARAIATVRGVAEEEGRLVAVMADLQGPKLRVGELPDEGVALVEGETVVLTLSPFAAGRIPVPHPEVFRDVQVGQQVLLDDGRLELVVEEAGAEEVRCRIVTGGRLTSCKGLNLPGAALNISALTPKDREDARFAVEQGVDFVALSFVRSPNDVEDLRSLLAGWEADLPIVAKIEKPEALAVFDNILRAADVVMVARGDLGVETPPEEVPFHQKRIIRACNLVGKPVITATQMLQTMIERPTPTRAEASDVANAILDGTDAVMLSGETAVGAYPVEAVRTMARICTNADVHLPLGRFLYGAERSISPTVTEAISQATVEIAAEVGAKAILTATMSGTTARMVARHRPAVPIVAVTPNRCTLMRLTMVWGVTPVLVPRFATTDEMLLLMVQAAHRRGFVQKGDLVILTAGIPFGGEGCTNMLKVHVVGEKGEAQREPCEG
ncbi:MAG TPA: pyruvate kinase [Chloroflexi bacterium]|nr:pyruvate kinase [Chloroflexota bacterium]